MSLVWQSVPQAFPRGEGGSRVPRKRETDEGHLPLPMGEVPLEGAERALFTLSVGFAASSPKGGAKGETDCHVGRWPPRNDMRDTKAPGISGGLPHQ